MGKRDEIPLFGVSGVSSTRLSTCGDKSRVDTGILDWLISISLGHWWSSAKASQQQQQLADVRL